MRENICALIAVRKGSKRVPNKNIRPFGDSSLLEIKIKQLLRIQGIENIYVSTDCPKMIEIAKSLGAKTSLRDPYYSSAEVPMNEVYEHLAHLVQSRHILFAHVTSPLISDKSLQDCSNTYISLPDGYDSLATVHTLHEYIWCDEGAVNYNPDHHPRSQDLPNYYALNFAVNLISKEDMIKRKNIVGKNFYPFALDEIGSIDVDTMLDFKIAEFIYNERL